MAAMPDPSTSPAEWANLAAARPVLWQSAVARLAETPYFPASNAPPEQEAIEEGVCFDCGACFPTKSALCSHRARKHGYRHPLRQKVEGTVCQYCLFDHFSRERLVYHLKRARCCRAFYQESVPDVPGEEARRLDADAASIQTSNLHLGLQPRFAREPPVRRVGPAVRPF